MSEQIDWKHRALCAEANLGMYRRAYCRLQCKDLYSSGARWEVVKHENFESNRQAFVREVCESGHRKTYLALPHAFDIDDAEEISYLLNRATDELFGIPEQLDNNKLSEQAAKSFSEIIIRSSKENGRDCYNSPMDKLADLDEELGLQ